MLTHEIPINPCTKAVSMSLIRSVMMSQNKNGHCSVGTFIYFVWVTMGRKILKGDISAKEEDIESQVWLSRD